MVLSCGEVTIFTGSHMDFLGATGQTAPLDGKNIFLKLNDRTDQSIYLYGKVYGLIEYYLENGTCSYKKIPSQCQIKH
jgi:hypothetical protein